MKNSVEAVAIYYSKWENSFLGKKIKDVLSKFNTYTIYLQDIDEVILKKFSQIDYLVLDSTSEPLDLRSNQLLNKLHLDGYICNILEITKEKKQTYFDCVVLGDGFESNINNYFTNCLKSMTDEKLVSKPYWVKIIGDYLVKIGVSSKHYGYSMLVDSFIYFISNNCLIKQLGKNLYPYLANKYKIKISSVEMRIRNTINSASKRQDVFPFSYCPTIKEFLTHILTQVYEKLFIKQVIY